jgi:hypothetical protein
MLFERQVNLFILNLIFNHFYSFKVLNEMIEHSSNMNIVIQKITEFYIENQLESDEIVG